jgi:hypothetical protein
MMTSLVNFRGRPGCRCVLMIERGTGVPEQARRGVCVTIRVR